MPESVKRILFYVEPHGVRDSFLEHSMPFDHFRRMANQVIQASDSNDSYDARIFCNHFLANAKFMESYIDWPLILQPTPSERRKIEDAAKMWIPAGIDDWIDLMTDRNAGVTNTYIEILDRVKREDFDYDVIVCWGSNAAVSCIAEKYNLQTVYIELASMRPPFLRSVLMDCVGVNGAASTCEVPYEQLEKRFSYIDNSLMFMLLNDELSPKKQASALYQGRMSQLPADVSAFIANSQKVALVPLQLSDDANQLLFSRYQTIDEFVDHSVEVLLESGWSVILKAHPHADQRGGHVMRDQRRCLAQYANRRNVFVLGGDLAAECNLTLMDSVNMVVTNNSSIGFEAMLLGKVVSVMGKACYAPPGALPPLEEALSLVENTDEWRHWHERSSITALYMLSTAFPLARNLGRELVRRVNVWEDFGYADVNSEQWLNEYVKTCAWQTWSDPDRMRKLSLL